MCYGLQFMLGGKGILFSVLYTWSICTVCRLSVCICTYMSVCLTKLVLYSSGCDRCCERDHSNPCCFSPLIQETPNSVFLVMEVGGVTLSECNLFRWAAYKLPGSLSLCWYLSPLSNCSLSLHVPMVISSVLWEAANPVCSCPHSASPLPLLLSLSLSLLKT